jgi:hypothetical protein
MVRRHARFIIVPCLTVLAVACSGDDRAPREVVVSPGITAFEPGDDVRPGDTIICRASNGDVIELVPPPISRVFAGSDISIEVHADGRVDVHCTKKIAQT